MKRVYPRLQDIQFLACEQLREEQFAKLSVLGWFIGNEIVFQPKPGIRAVKPPFVMPSLSFVFVLKGGAGEFEATFSLVDPEGGVLIKPAKLGTQKMVSPKAHMIGIQTSAATFKSLGLYTVVLQLDQKRYEFPLKVGVRTKKEAIGAQT